MMIEVLLMKEDDSVKNEIKNESICGKRHDRYLKSNNYLIH